jgi:tetratricopeptide (TPR) repeat protein
MAVSLPFVLLLLDWFDGQRIGRRAIIEKLPHVVICLGLFAVTFAAHGRIPGEDGSLQWPIVVWCLGFYVAKFLFPYPLSPLYALPEPVAWTNPSYATAAAVIAAVIILSICLRRVRWWTFAFLYFLISIAIMLKIDAREASLVADRYMYLPSLGFCLLAGWLWGGWMTPKSVGWRRGLAWACFVFVFACALAVSSRYIPVWKDSFSLWNHVIAQGNARPIAFNNRGSLYFKKNNYPAALRDFNEALSRDPAHLNALFNRGLLYETTGRPDEARRDYSAALILARQANDKELIALLEMKLIIGAK